MSQQVSAHITREQGNNGFFTGAHNFSFHDAQFNNYVTLSSGKDIKQKLREELKFVEDAGIDDDKICLPDTRRAIIKEITDWVQPKDDSKASRTYILYGEAGTGKSAIAHTVGKELQELQFLVGFFAFNRSMLESRTPSNALHTIAYTLGAGDHDFAEGLIQSFEEDPSISGSTSIQRQWEKLIVAPAQRVDPAKHVVIIFDALDESGPQMQDEPRDRLLSVLMSGKHDLPSNFWVFVTSRLENDIMAYLERFIYRDPLARVQKMTDIKGTDEDIYRFVVKKMSGGGGGLGILEESQCWSLATKAEGYFQWVSTVCKVLSGGGKGGLSVQTRFDEFMSTAPGSLHKTLTPLDRLYMTILEESFDQEAMERYREVMGLVLAAFEPLPRTSLKKLQIMGSHHHGIIRHREEKDTTLDAGSRDLP
ncbi:hypothetical protein BDP27DRAFT_1438081 [Rhodocollybia butyracea]|uniref:Nephrocystin 3-like N-terminal domain-containing protein n=1 Tax=Rhodocollybia butyracea TaxID=206335 RepID=A0A9P5TVS4_9AGAR|nr:hypothetical protein BDP27DRAFT_1438081 [Rhodocollybia butyracea]